MISILIIISYSSNKIKNQKKIIEKIFLDILNNCTKIQFSKRINKYVYFKYEKLEIIYLIDKKSLTIFEKDQCIATSISIPDSKVIEDLIKYLKTKWKSDINNIVVIDNNVFSVNFIEEQKAQISLKSSLKYDDPLLNQIESNNINNFTIDDILDKINKVGYKNLTSSEIDFLNNASK